MTIEATITQDDLGALWDHGGFVQAADANGAALGPLGEFESEDVAAGARSVVITKVIHIAAPDLMPPVEATQVLLLNAEKQIIVAAPIGAARLGQNFTFDLPIGTLTFGLTSE